MKRVIRMVSVGVMVLGAVEAFAADPLTNDQRVKWLSTVTDGCYNDPANWTDGILPANGIDGRYGYVDFQTQDITLRAPAGGLVENSGSIFLGTGAGTHTLTIDTRGTFWEKKGLKSVNNWWGSPFAQNLTGTHIFNFEGLDSVANEKQVWRFEDALFTWKSTGTSRQDFDLWSGTFTFGKDLYLGSSGGAVNFYIHPEAKLYSPEANFIQRGNATTHTWFLGGSNTVGSIMLKDNNANAGTTWMHITNDAVVVARWESHLGNQSASQGTVVARSRGILDVSCTARLVTQGALRLGSGKDVTNRFNRGDVTIRDAAALDAAAISVGWRSCATGVLEVVDNASLTMSGSLYLGQGSNSWGYVTLAGHSRNIIGGILGIAYQTGVSSHGEFVMDDDATVSLSPDHGNWLCLGSHTHAGSVARFTAKGRSRLTAAGSSSIEMGYGFDADLELNVTDDAVVTFPNGYVTNKVPIGGRSVVSLSSNGVLAVRYVRGGVPVTGEPCMQLVADGGTLKVSGTTTPPVPFLCGCASATIGEHGFALDPSGFDVSIDQAFTAAAGVADATFTKAGLGTLTVLRNSSHPRTRVAQGALRFGTGVTRFGNVLEVAAGAKLVLTDSAATIAADALAFTGTLELVVPDDYVLDQSYPVLAVSGGLTPEQMSRIVISNPEAGKAYALTLDGDGQTVKLVVSAAAAGAKTWAGGASGSWNADANWDPAGVPTHNDDVTIGAAAAIALSASAEAATISAPAAAVSISGTSPLYVSSGVDVAAGGTLAVSAPVRNASGTVAKSGTGKLDLAGDNTATFAGDWRLEQGVTEFKSAAALGAGTASAGGLSISNCTFRYSGEATEIERPWRLIGEYPSVFDIVHDLTFNNFKVSSVQRDGGFVKLGAGTLTLNVPSGTSTLSWRTSSPVRGSNSDINGLFAPTTYGEVTNWDGVAQMTVLEGRLAIVGQGKTVSTVKQEHHGGIGGSGYVASAPPELYLKDLAITLGSGNGFHMLMGSQMAAGSAAPRLILDNANVTCNGLNVGHNKVSGNAETVRPVLAITNGTLDITWQMQIPTNVGGIEPIVRVGTNGAIRRVSATTAGGIKFYKKIDARFEDGGILEVGSPQSIWLWSDTSGSLVFARGGGMKTHRLLAYQSTAEIVLDGGFAQFTLNGGISTTKSPATCCIRADAGGGELIVGSGVEHTLAVPLRGGRFVKTGAGTLVLTNDLNFTAASDAPTGYSSLASTTVKVANTGGVEIAEGVLKCVAGTTDASSRFSGVGTLSGEFDAFTLAVDPGATDALTFSDLTASRVTVDFGRAAGEPIRVRDMPETVVAKVATESEFRAISWRGENCGDGIVCEFRYDSADHVVRARFRSSGVVIIFR